MFEPFLSVLLTFGGIYFLWLDISWMKYVIMISGMFMTFSFMAATILILFQLTQNKPS
jgi:hypothetical protein